MTGSTGTCGKQKASEVPGATVKPHGNLRLQSVRALGLWQLQPETFQKLYVGSRFSGIGKAC